MASLCNTDIYMNMQCFGINSFLLSGYSSAHNRSTDRKVAIKKVSCVFEDTIDAKRVLREIRLMKRFNHENVL